MYSLLFQAPVTIEPEICPERTMDTRSGVIALAFPRILSAVNFDSAYPSGRTDSTEVTGNSGITVASEFVVLEERCPATDIEDRNTNCGGFGKREDRARSIRERSPTSWGINDLNWYENVTGQAMCTMCVTTVNSYSLRLAYRTKRCQGDFTSWYISARIPSFSLLTSISINTARPSSKPR